MSGKDKAMYSPPGSLHALVPSGSVDKNSSKQDWLSREVVVEISAETDGDAGHRGPGPTAQEVESGVRLSLDSSDMAGGGGDDDDDSRAAGTPSGVQVKWKSWHDRVQVIKYSLPLTCLCVCVCVSASACVCVKGLLSPSIPLSLAVVKLFILEMQ